MKMTTEHLVCGRPINCRYCGHAYYGLDHMVQEAQNLEYDIADYAGIDCVKEKIRGEAIPTYDPIFFFGVGHGDDCVYTDDNEAPIWTCSDTSDLAGRIVYLWSCLTGNGLGPDIIQKGGWAYAGFNISWTWTSDSGTDGDPYEDTYARGFWESGNELIKALLLGKPISLAADLSRDKYTEWINYWKASDDPLATECIKWLTHDRGGLVIFGDGNARLGPIIDCSQITNEQECLSNYCHWYDGSCHDIPLGCDELNMNECFYYNCFWYDGSCHSEAQTVLPGIAAVLGICCIGLVAIVWMR